MAINSEQSNTENSSLLPTLVEPSMFDDFEFDVLQEISSSYDTDVTENPVETGFVVADHVIKKPVKLSLTVLFTPTNVTWNDRRGGVVKTRLQDVEKQLKTIRDKGEPGTVKTLLNVYKNMIMTSVKLTRDKTGFKIIANFEFTEVIIVDTKTAAVNEQYANQAQNAAANDNAAQDSTDTSVDGGDSAGNEADTTTAQDQAGKTDTSAGTAETKDITPATNNTNTAQTGAEETANTANKSYAASV